MIFSFQQAPLRMDRNSSVQSPPVERIAMKPSAQWLRKFHFELSELKSYGAKVGVLSAMEYST